MLIEIKPTDHEIEQGFAHANTHDRCPYALAALRALGAEKVQFGVMSEAEMTVGAGSPCVAFSKQMVVSFPPRAYGELAYTRRYLIPRPVWHWAHMLTMRKAARDRGRFDPPGYQSIPPAWKLRVKYKDIPFPFRLVYSDRIERRERKEIWTRWINDDPDWIQP